MVNRLIPVCH